MFYLTKAGHNGFQCQNQTTANIGTLTLVNIYSERRYTMRELFLDLFLAVALGLAFATLALAYFDVLI